MEASLVRSTVASTSTAARVNWSRLAVTDCSDPVRVGAVERPQADASWRAPGFMADPEGKETSKVARASSTDVQSRVWKVRRILVATQCVDHVRERCSAISQPRVCLLSGATHLDISAQRDAAHTIGASS